MATEITYDQPGIVALIEAWQFVSQNISTDKYKLFCNLLSKICGRGVALFVNKFIPAHTH